MKNIFALSLFFLLVLSACNKSNEGLTPEPEFRNTEKEENIIRNPNKSVVSCDDLSISHKITYQSGNCCNYKFDLKALGEGKEIPVLVKLVGIDYEEFLVKDTETFFLSLCPDPEILVEIFVGENLCFSKLMTCECSGNCGDVNITSDLVSDDGECCRYSINFDPVCDNGIGVLLDLYVDGTVVQNLNITSSASVLVEVCGDEKKEIEVGARRGICFSETLGCKNCCSEIEYEINSQHLGDGCCEFTFELLGSEECMDSYVTAFGWNQEIGLDGIDFYEFVGNVIRVRKCIPEQYVNFVIFDTKGDEDHNNDEICFISSNLQYCQD